MSEEVCFYPDRSLSPTNIILSIASILVLHQVAWHLQVMSLGTIQCADAFLYVFTVFPIRLCVAACEMILLFLDVIFRAVFLRSTTSRQARLFPTTCVCELIKGCIIILGVWLFTWVDLSVVYHFLRGQAVVKLYIMFNMLEVSDPQSIGVVVSLTSGPYDRSAAGKRGALDDTRQRQVQRLTNVAFSGGRSSLLLLWTRYTRVPVLDCIGLSSGFSERWERETTKNDPHWDYSSNYYSYAVCQWVQVPLRIKGFFVKWEPLVAAKRRNCTLSIMSCFLRPWWLSHFF